MSQHWLFPVDYRNGFGRRLDADHLLRTPKFLFDRSGLFSTSGPLASATVAIASNRYSCKSSVMRKEASPPRDKGGHETQLTVPHGNVAAFYRRPIRFANQRP